MWRERDTQEIPRLERIIPLGRNIGKDEMGELVCDAIKALANHNHELCELRCQEYWHMRSQGHEQPPMGDKIIELLERNVCKLTVKTRSEGL